MTERIVLLWPNTCTKNKCLQEFSPLDTPVIMIGRLVDKQVHLLQVCRYQHAPSSMESSHSITLIIDVLNHLIDFQPLPHLSIVLHI